MKNTKTIKVSGKEKEKNKTIKKVVFRLDSDSLYKIKRIALEKRTTQNDLFVEAIYMLIDKYKEYLK